MAAPKIAVLSSHRHPRLRYILAQMSRWTGYEFLLYTQVDKYLKTKADARINYGQPPCEALEMPLYAHSFLSGKSPEAADLQPTFRELYFPLDFTGAGLQKNSSPVFMTNQEGDDFDPWSIIFFCLSRWEEYQVFTADQHQRFPAKASHAHQYGYLEQPLVNTHLGSLIARLGQLFPALPKPNYPTARLELSYDIDIPFAFRFRGWRGWASGCKDLLFGPRSRAWQRLKTLLGQQLDPFDTFAQLETLHQALGHQPLTFWLLAAQRTAFDPNLPPTSAIMQRLIPEVARWSEIGIHPSYFTSDTPDLIAHERSKLKEISGQHIRNSRQHFLRFRFPSTYTQLIRAGIQHDYSMGYADAIGWRAGTNYPFYWYNLETEHQTHLIVHPFAAMDVTLLRYQHLAAREVPAKLHVMAQQVKPFGGPFTLLWHNSSFADAYGWAGWWEMYTTLVHELTAYFASSEDRLPGNNEG